MSKSHSISPETERALLGIPLLDMAGASVETRLALLNTEALHIGDLVRRRIMPEPRALPGLMRYARALRLDCPEAAAYLGELPILEVVKSLLRAAMERPMQPAILAAADALETEAAAVAGARPGTKVDRLTEAGRALGQLLGGGVLDEYFAHDALMRAAEAAGLSAQVASRAIADGLEAGKRARAERGSGRTGRSSE